MAKSKEKSKFLTKKVTKKDIEEIKKSLVFERKIVTKNDLYVDKLEKLKDKLQKVIEEVETLEDAQRFDQIQNLIGHLEKLL